MQFRIAEIDARRPSSGAIIECLRFDGDGRQGKPPSSLLAIAEIHSTAYAYERLLDTLHAAVTQTRALITKMEGDPMVRFEKIVQKANEAFAHFASSEAAPLQWQRVNLFLFQLGEGHLCFSGIGSLANLFLQQQPGGGVRAFDLLGSLEQPEAPDPRKPLPAIVCGTMGVGDVLFVGTKNIETVRERIGLADLCENRPPVAAALEIQQQLQALRPPTSFFGVVMAGVALTATKGADAPRATPPSAEPTPAEELAPTNALHEAEQDTDRVLDQGSEANPLQTLAASGKNLLAALGARLRGLNGKTEGRKEALSPLSLAGLRGMHAGHARELLTKNRSVAIGAGLAVVLLLAGGFWLQAARRQQAEQKLWTAVYDQAVEAKNRAEAALVYNDEAKAQAQYTQALAGLRQLDEASPDRAQAKATLKTGLDEIQTRLRKERTVAEPRLIADLRADGQAPSLQSLVIQNGKAFTLNKTRNQLVAITLQDGTSAPLAGPEGVTLRLLGNGRDAPLVLGNERQLFTVRSQGLSPLNANALSKASSTAALTVYGTRAYLLDPTKGMIWRYALSRNGLSGESAYLPAPSASLEQGVALAIDASVYMGKQTGEVEKFTSGKADAWSLRAIDPPLQAISSLWTDAESPVLAVADAANKRVVIFNKDGSLRQQILSPAFQGPMAVWGVSQEQALYALDGGRLFKLELPGS